MPKRTSGGPKVPVRALTSLFRELDPQTKNILNSAFADAENLIDFHSESVPERQNRRRISGLIKTINLTGEGNLLGGFVKWERLDDPRISFYELEISDDSVFSNPDRLTSLDTFFSLENIRTVKFVRVRGVRPNGETGLWSNFVRISPHVSAPTVATVDFYQRYTNSAEPGIIKEFRYSRGNSKTHADFYTVLSADFYADRLFGGLTAWGYITSRLRKYRDGGFIPWDRVRFRVDGIARMDGYFPHWVNSPEARPDAFCLNDFHATTGAKMTFYMQGGYTASFGPYAVSLPNTLAGEGPNDPYSVVNMDTLDGAFYWYDPMNAARASTLQEAQLLGFNDTVPRHEAHADQLIEGGRTDWLIFRDFRFDIPNDRAILGIEAKIKRRQPNIVNNRVGVNFGVKRPDRALGHDLVQEHFLSTVRLQPNHIFEDVNFGRGIDLTCNTTGTSAFGVGRLLHDVSGIPDDGTRTNTATKLFTGPRHTISVWFRIPTPLSAYHTGIRETYMAVPEAIGDGLAAAGMRMFVNTNATTNTISNYTVRFEANVFKQLVVTPTTPLARVNEWHHYVYTWDSTVGPTGQIRIFLDGAERATTETTNFVSNVTKNLFTGNRNWFLALGGFNSLVTKLSIASMAHYAIWDKILTAQEIRELYEAKGRVDYRKNFGDYASAAELCHYFFVFPERTDVRDLQVCLVDEDGDVRTDLDNKALTDESWPQLGDFFYTDLRQHTFLPLAVSDGPTHDNHLAIGYQNYGGEFDTWGTSWTPAQINSFYFGVAIRATNEVSLGYRGDAFVDHAKVTVFTQPRFDRTVNLRVEVAAVNQFYFEREIFGGLMNLLEIGERLVEEEE